MDCEAPFWFTVMASSMDEQLVPEATVGVGTVGGKHRILAELKRLEQELKYLQVFVHLFPLNFTCFLFVLSISLISSIVQSFSCC